MMSSTLDTWIENEAIPFDTGSPQAFHAAVDRLVASLDDSVRLLGFGEALHGGEAILRLRNRLFQRLVEAHGYSAIAIESSFPRGQLTNAYVAGHGPDSYDALLDRGFSHGFGELAANRELVEWMRAYNADPAHRIKLSFYGFDQPALRGGIAGPRQVLYVVLDYLTALDNASGQAHRQQIDALLGPDSDWENPAGMMDPAQSIGLSPAATALRIATEALITELRVRRPELVAQSDPDRHAEALHYAALARQLLNYHAAAAQPSAAGTPQYDLLLAIRDAVQADNLVYIVDRERARGKVLAFAHNSHLQRGKAVWPWYAFWPVGSQLAVLLGPAYAVIGSAVGVSDENGIGQPEAGSLEARFAALAGSALFIPTHRGDGLPAEAIATLPVRSGSTRNPGYGVLTAQSLSDFDWLAFVASTPYSRGGPPLPESDASVG